MTVSLGNDANVKITAIFFLGTVAIAVVSSFVWGQHVFLQGKRKRVLGVIPARYDSSRFPGKPLVNIHGKPMIQRTWEQVMMTKTLNTIVVATDDIRIKQCCEDFGASVVMTSNSCRNGTERCFETLSILGIEKYDLVVNIQGDEPLIDPLAIDGVVLSLKSTSDAVCSTAVTHLKPSDADDRNRVKCVVDVNGYALYFSRSLIPGNKNGTFSSSFPYFLHMGLMCYDTKYLSEFTKHPTTPLQEEEDLEQLKILETGRKIKVICVEHFAHGVDVPEDVEMIERQLTLTH